jgi:hypothetical protein
VFLNLLFFLVFIIISSYLFFSKYLEFCEKYFKIKSEKQNKIIDRLNNIRWQKNYNESKNFKSNKIIDVECEVIEEKVEIKGYLK